MRYFHDWEFIEDGRTIDPISVGIAAEDGREYYAISSEFDEGRASMWVVENVLRKLPPASELQRIPRQQIAKDIWDFIIEDNRDHVELWANYGAYDHIALCQLYGPMINLPPHVPMFTNDFQQLWRAKGKPVLPPDPEDAHDALVDARHLRYCFSVTAASR